jgi:hypothetical protein
MKKTAWLAFAVLVLGTFAIAAAEADITGTWVGKTAVPDYIEPDELTVVIEKTEQGYQGVVNDTLGYCDDAECMDIELDGEELTFNFTIVDGSLIFITLKVEGETMTGQWENEGGSGAEMVLQRKK